MEVSCSHQMYVFGMFVLSGVVCGAFFDVQRFLRTLHKAGHTRTQLEDIIFAVICIGVAIGMSYFFNDGKIRYYQIMGSVSGALFYAAVLSRVFMKILQAFSEILNNVVIKPVFKIICILYAPIRKILQLLIKQFAKIKRAFLRIWRNIKKRKKQLKKRIKML